MDQAYKTRISIIFSELNLPLSFCETTKIPLCEEANDLTHIEKDIFGREQRLLTPVAKLWSQMKAAAKEDGIQLLVVSAFRSVDYQKQLILNKINKGIGVDKILKVNTPPGYSEHHTGRALDITTSDCEPLTEAFELTEAFTWLVTHASKYQFSLTYPRDNPYGIIYEPWHWAVRAEDLI